MAGTSAPRSETESMDNVTLGPPHSHYYVARRRAAEVALQFRLGLLSHRRPRHVARSSRRSHAARGDLTGRVAKAREEMFVRSLPLPALSHRMPFAIDTALAGNSSDARAKSSMPVKGLIS